ncbi:MAG: hypothetical protein JWO44_1087 [Bacteroidetes bacterium]|nr:hypothetical protein [Bacteroidota bacterium]
MEQTIYKIALVVHIVGITIMSGTTFIDFISFRHFWKILPENRPAALVTADSLYKLQRFMGIGMLIIILSGVGMMIFLHQVWGQQIWFRVKIGILVLIIINGLAIRRRLGNNLKKLLVELPGTETDSKLSKLKSNMTVVHLFQMLFFVAIFILSVFKFN